MTREGTHLHDCSNTPAGCTGTYLCSDEYLERNHDPDGVICGVDPRSEGLCNACAARQRDQCHDCGEPAVQVIEDADDASGYRGETAYCAECWAKREHVA